jgi:hypothetical protein
MVALDDWSGVSDLFDYCDPEAEAEYAPSAGILGVGEVWATVRVDAGPFGSVFDGVPATNLYVNYYDDGFDPPLYVIMRAIFVFSLLGENRLYTDSVVILTPSFYLADLSPPLATPAMPSLCLVISNSNKTIPHDDYLPEDYTVGFVLASDDIVDLNTLATPDKILFNLNAAGLAHVNSSMGSQVEFMVLDYTHDFMDVAPTINSAVDPYPFGGILLADEYDCAVSELTGPVLAGNGVDLNLAPISIYQYIKAASLNDAGIYEKHTFITRRNGEVVHLDHDPPTPSPGLGSVIFDAGANLTIKPSWGNINNLLIYSDGYSQHQIWTGDREKIKAAFLVVPASGADIWEKVVDDIGGVTTAATIPNIVANTNGIFVCTQTPARAFHFLIGSAQTGVMTAVIKNYTLASGFVDSTIPSDTTQDTGRSFYKDGSIEFNISGAEAPTDMYGISGYWYQITANNNASTTFTIQRIEYSNPDFSSLENVWDGALIEIIEAQVFYPTDGVVTEAYYTYPASLVTISELPATGYIYMATIDEVAAFVIDVGVTPNTAATRTISKLQYWTGIVWADIVPFTDETSCFTNSGRIKVNTQVTSQPYRFNGAQLATFWYRIKPTAAISDTCSIGISYVPRLRALSSEFGAVGMCNAVWKDRAIYVFERYPSDLYVTGGGTPNVLNGNDFGILSAGDGRKNKIVCMKKFHNELMVWQSEHGQEGGSLTLFEGYSPATFGKLVLSSKVGGISAAACVVVDGSAAAPTRRDDMVQTRAYWVSHYGFFMSDGRTVQRISDDIQNYFDQRNPECLRRGFEAESWAQYDSSDNVVRFGIVSGNSSDICNVFPVYDVTTGTWTFDAYEEENEIISMTEADAESGDVSVLQIGCSLGKYFLMNTGLNDDGFGIDSICRVQMNNTAALIDLEEVWVRMLVQASGVCTFAVYENGLVVTELAESVSMAAVEAGDTIRRERLIKGSRQESNIAFQFQNAQVDIDLFLYDYFVDYSILGQR